jgi:CRP-like cAMP-binding protein
MRAAKLPRALRHLVEREFSNNAKQDVARVSSVGDAHEVLQWLSPALRQRIVLHSNRRVLSLLPLLHTEPAPVQAAVLEHLTRLSAAGGDVLVAEGSLARSILFLARGRVSLFHDDEFVAKLSDGALLGDVDVLFSSTRLFTIRADAECEIYILSRSDLSRVISEHAEFGTRLKSLSLARLRRLQQRLGRVLISEDTLTQLRRMRVGVARNMPWSDSFNNLHAAAAAYPNVDARSKRSARLPREEEKEEEDGGKCVMTTTTTTPRGRGHLSPAPLLSRSQASSRFQPSTRLRGQLAG